MQFPMNYPLSLSFKIVALAPQLSVTDANGALVAYVKQKLFKLREDVTVFEDKEQTRPAFNMKADKIIDWSPRFQFVDQLGRAVGSVKREGRQSLWKAHYDVYDGESVGMLIREENPWVKVWDGLIGAVPILGALSGYLFHPAYLVTIPDGRLVMKMTKQPAFWEGKFLIEKLGDLGPEEEKRAMLSLMMVVLMERIRG